MVQDVAKNLCAQMTTDVFAVVPRLEDYTCPVCLSLAWLPVRLKCHHIFCIRCVIKMQREYKRHCPLCRGNVVMQADLGEQRTLRRTSPTAILTLVLRQYRSQSRQVHADVLSKGIKREAESQRNGAGYRTLRGVLQAFIVHVDVGEPERPFLSPRATGVWH